MNKQTKNQILSVAGLLFTTFVWGITFTVVKMAIVDMNMYYFLFLRFALASLLMTLIFHKKIIRADKSTILAALLLSLLLATAYISQTEGLKITSSANSALITCLYMIFIPIFSFTYSKSRPEWFSIAGIVFAFTGMYLLTCFSLTGINWGDFLILVCAVLFAWHFILTGKFSRAHKIVPLVAYQLIFSAIICGTVAIIQHGATLHISQFALATILFTALFATIIAFLIQTAAQRVLSPTRTGIICSMEAVFGALIPWVLNLEQATLISAVGACLMVVGMIISEIKPQKAPQVY